jgi:hypothetical protein
MCSMSSRCGAPPAIPTMPHTSGAPRRARAACRSRTAHRLGREPSLSHALLSRADDRWGPTALRGVGCAGPLRRSIPRPTRGRQTKAFLGVRSKAAQKGAATRAKKKKAKAGDPAKP